MNLTKWRKDSYFQMPFREPAKKSGPFWLQGDTSGDYKKALLTVVT